MVHYRKGDDVYIVCSQYEHMEEAESLKRLGVVGTSPVPPSILAGPLLLVA